ncbi:MAG TPA: glycosyltransferase family 4 protein [Pirellulales bacterium]|nr:glycosyltransferase family 4 protein [Pirellulales bacterium]
MTGTLRIAVCLSHFHPVVGGAERKMQQLAERWARLGHQPFVLTRVLPGSNRREEVDGVEINRVIHTAAVGPAFGATFIGSLSTQLLRRARRFDVMVAGQLPWESVATGFVSRVVSKPSVAFAASTGREGDVQQILAARGGPFLRRMVLNNSRFIALSQQGHDELHELGCREEAIVRSTNGVDLQRFRPCDDGCADRDRTVLYLSRLVPAKNPQVLLRAWKRVNAEGRYRLLIAGDGPLDAELRRIARDEKLNDVEFLGHVTEVAAAHRRAGTFVLPSPSEGCSNALLEAMAGGLCPVVTRVPGNIDVVQDRVNGLLFDHDDDEQLAGALVAVLADASLRRKLAAAAREHVERHHDLDRIAAELIGLFQELQTPDLKRAAR